MCAVEKYIKQMLLVDATQLGKELDRDASVFVFDKAFDDSKEFTLGQSL
jgi:hypothetical protein